MSTAMVTGRTPRNPPAQAGRVADAGTTEYAITGAHLRRQNGFDDATLAHVVTLSTTETAQVFLVPSGYKFTVFSATDLFFWG